MSNGPLFPKKSETGGDVSEEPQVEIERFSLPYFVAAPHVAGIAIK